MNRRVCVCVGLIVWSGLMARAAFAQDSVPSTAATGGVPVEYKSMANAAPFSTQIGQFIQGQLNGMAADDPVVAKAAREKLIAECTAGSSPSYFQVYSQQLNVAVVAMLAKNPPPRLRIRLNLGVMLEAVARTAETDQLEGAIIALINDPADVVALWGMKAAKPAIAAVLANPTPDANDKLIKAIMPAVKLHAKAGYVAGEAYAALIPNPNNISAGTLAAVINPMLDILDYRVSLYMAVVPDTEQAETTAGRFLSSSAVRDTLMADQKQKAVQLLVNLIMLAGVQAQTASKADVQEIISMCRLVAQDLQLLSEPTEPNLSSIVQMSLNTPGADVFRRTQTLFGTLKPVFPNLTQPPTATPAAPATTTAN